MDVKVSPGKYVIAVSGGVDSMVLFDMLQQLPGVELIAAHLDHGIRTDSTEDRKLVERIAKSYDTPFIYEEAKLGKGASEEQARTVRYDFLERVRKERDADAIITAHHQDDVLETAILNMLRGTGRKGLSSLQDRPGILRPMMRVSKHDILEYAEAHDITWREDSTNASDKYLRNYVRLNILTRFDDSARARLLEYIEKASESNAEIDSLLLSDQTTNELNRQWFTGLPHSVATETMAAWLRQNGVRDFDRQLIEKLVVGAKTLSPGKQKDVNAGLLLKIGKDNLTLLPRESRKN